MDGNLHKKIALVALMSVGTFCGIFGEEKTNDTIQKVQIVLPDMPPEKLDDLMISASGIASELCFTVAEEAKKAFAGIEPLTIKVQPDLSHLGDEAGKAISDVIQKSAEGFGEVMSSDKLGKSMTTGMTGLVNNASGAFNNAAHSKEFENNIADGATKILTNFSHAFKKMGTDETLGDDISEGMQGVFKKATGAFKDAAQNEEAKSNVNEAFKSMSETGAGGLEAFHSGPFFDELGTMYRRLVGSFINMHNVTRYGGMVALTGATIVTGFHGTRVLWRVIEKRLVDPKPVILLPGTKYGRMDRVRRWWSGYKSPAMIFPQGVEERLLEIIEKVKNIRINSKKGMKITFDNLLLHGKPGTGKTLFAKILADETNMDFVSVTAASLLQSGVEGVKYFDELMELARRSKYGLIIFVDEADALFVDRDSLKPDSDHYKVLNHILALTGEGSKAFMLVAATNHANVIDGAMERRFQDRVDMPLPDIATRKKLVDLYVATDLFNLKDNNKKFVDRAKAVLTQIALDYIVEKTEGLSSAEIKDIMQSIRKKALATKKALITAVHVKNAVQQAVEKHEAFLNDKQK